MAKALHTFVVLIENNINDILNFTGRHPLLGTIVTAGQALFVHLHINTNVMDLLQIAAWSAPFGTFILFALGWLKKNTTLFDKIKWMKDSTK